jgi:predicted DNA-binding transcriptional regulator YafY
MGTSPPSERRDRQIVRVLGILKLLVDGGHPTVYELAARFRTRRETIYRDLHALEAVGYPIIGDEAGRLSRPRLAPEARPALPPVLLTREELAALVWSLKQTHPRQPFRSALATTLPKLQSLASRKDSNTALVLDGAVGGWQRGVKDYAGFEPTILRLVESIVSRRRCRLEYQAPGRATAKRFPYDPYRLLVLQGAVYCVGKVPAYANLVTLAVDRVRAIDLLDERFVPDPAFDPKRHEAEAFGVVWERPMAVVLRFRADQAPYVREREWHPSQQFRTLRDGRLEMRFRAGGTFEIVRWILGWGDAVEVVQPPSLRALVEATHRSALAAYRGRRRVRLDRTGPR